MSFNHEFKHGSDISQPMRATDRGSADHVRSDRLFNQSGLWYFKTREGRDVGPFRYRDEAELMLTRFVRELAEQQQKALSSIKPHFRISALMGRDSR
ncbi:DUF6316 family protein [Pseudohongiella spirulinae]|uniref:DUF6316 domain-containing protein n=1 Tax=Pseudohongiella spirulinae TaxID=1249552 RepID=A0A0S2KCX1_9GAMM|nr:DUF6316 family protein [Pseudohongiella spirulinae]ALO46089.1 hypothetical protein PS2015_1432 [Pseudohongiella spirulinae]